MKRIKWGFLALLLLPNLVFAAPSALVYTRTPVPVERANAPEGTSATLTLDAEVRDAKEASRLPGWFGFTAPTDLRAALLTYATPSQVTLSAANEYAPVDILFIDEYGVIMQIAPNIVRAELREPITSEKPVLALMLLRGGACEQLGIQPGDRVQYNIFKKKPAVLSVPENKS